MNQSASNSQKTAIAFKTLPPEMATALRQIIRRVRTIIIFRGVLATFSVALIAIMAVMAIDATTVILDSTIRLLLSGAVLLVTLITAFRRLVMPLARPFTPVRMARLIERRRPELEERLSTVVEILSGGTRLVGSERLFSKLMETACNDIREFRPEQEFTMRTVKPRLIAAGTAFAILFILLVAFPRPAGRLFLRAIAPHAQVGNFYAGLLQIEPGDAHLLRNQPVEIIATVSPQLQSHPVIRRSFTGKTRDESVERMHFSDTLSDGSRVYRHVVPAVNAPFAYRVVAGFSVSRQYQIRVLDVPALDHLQLEIVHPPYTGRKPVILTNNFHNLSALVGSGLKWTARYNRTPMQSDLRFGNASLKAQTSPNDTSWHTTLIPGPARSWSIHLTDTYGYTNTPSAYSLTIREDAPPQVQIARPQTRRIELPPTTSLTLTGIFVDDFKIVNPTLEWAINDAPYSGSQSINSLTPTADAQTWTAQTTLELGRLLLDNVKKLRVRLRAEDNLPAYLHGPQSGTSDEIIVILNREAQSAAAQAAAVQNETIKDALEDVKRGLEEAVQQTETAEKHAATDQVASHEALDAVQKKLAEAEARAHETAEATQDSLHTPIAKALEDLAESHLQTAKRQTEAAQLAEPESLADEIATLKNKLQEALEATQKLAEENKAFGDELGKLIDLDSLADREEALAEKARRTDDASALETLRKEQESLRREMKQTIPHDPEVFKKMLEKQQQELQAASAESHALAETQEQLRKHMQALEDPDKHEATAEALAEMAESDAPESAPEALAHDLQEALAEQTQALADKTRELQESLKDWGHTTEESARLAKKGADEAKKASKKADEASRKSADSSPPPVDAEALHEAVKQEAQAAIETKRALLEVQQQATEAEAVAIEAAKTAGEAQEAAEEAGDALHELLETVQADADAQAQAEAIDAAQTRADEAHRHAEDTDTAADIAQATKQAAAEAVENAKNASEEAEARAEEAARRMADAEKPSPEPTSPRHEDPTSDQKDAQKALSDAAQAFEQAADAMQPLLEQLAAAIESKKTNLSEDGETANATAPDQASPNANHQADNLIEAEAAMFDALDEWEELSDLMSLEENAAAAAKAQQQALQHQQAAEDGDQPETIQKAQEQAGKQQKQASDAFKRLTDQLAELDLAENVLDSWEAAREAQHSANQQQKNADTAQREAKRAQSSEAGEADAQALAEAAQQAQTEATAEQRRAAAIQSTANLATKAERAAQRDEHRAQAANAAQAAAEAMRNEARARAEQLGISPETLAENLTAAPPGAEPGPLPAPSPEQPPSGKPGPEAENYSIAPVAEFQDVEVDPLTPEGRRSLLPDWFRLRGSPRAGADEERWQDVPAEYRPLVQDYFRKLSEEENNE